VTPWTKYQGMMNQFLERRMGLVISPLYLRR
jgi:hypothetical protein